MTMTVQKSIKCDSCGKELCCVTQYPAVYAIEVSSINVNTPECGGTYAVVVRPPFKEPHHFCNKECLGKFIKSKEHQEAINIIRTIRCMIDRDFNDKRFKQHVLSLLHSTSRGCIGCDKDIPEELIKYDLPKEWD